MKIDNSEWSAHDVDAAIDKILLCEGKNFSELVAISGLDPATDFQFANLNNVSFTGIDLNGFDFRGSSFVGSTFEFAKLGSARFSNIGPLFGQLQAAEDWFLFLRQHASEIYDKYCKYNSEKLPESIRKISSEESNGRTFHFEEIVEKNNEGAYKLIPFLEKVAAHQSLIGNHKLAKRIYGHAAVALTRVGESNKSSSNIMKVICEIERIENAPALATNPDVVDWDDRKEEQRLTGIDDCADLAARVSKFGDFAGAWHIIDDMVSAYESRFSEQPALVSLAFFRAGEFLMELRDIMLARQKFEAARKLRETAFGRHHPLTTTAVDAVKRASEILRSSPN